MSVRVRFPPSPTGYLHVGGARTALFNFLFARNHGGTFVLRIEDTDRTRFQEGAVADIYSSLKWLGLDWDEGPDKGGEYGPYIQSERTEIYQKHADELIEKGAAYRCFCTPERLQAVREKQQKEKSQLGYDKHCRNLSDTEIKASLKENKPFVVRLKIPDSREVTFEDAIRGEIKYNSNVLDDLVLLKTDGFPTYHLANVVDDHLMKITHVLRGDEWIASTPKHVVLYEAFGWTPPVFAHMPVILSSQGGKLSKRKGAASVMDFQRAGYTPEALFNFLALLGWAPGDDKEVMTRDETVKLFSLEKISPKASVFDEKKLEWMNGVYMQGKDDNEVLNVMMDLWQKEDGFPAELVQPTSGLAIVRLLKSRSKTYQELLKASRYFFVDPKEYEEKGAKKHFKGAAGEILESLVGLMASSDMFDEPSLEALYTKYAQENELSGGKLIHPTRLAVSGVSFGPGLFELLAALGKDTVLRRMKKAIEWIKEQNA